MLLLLGGKGALASKYEFQGSGGPLDQFSTLFLNPVRGRGPVEGRNVIDRVTIHHEEQAVD